MSQERLGMKKLRDVLRLHYECELSNRKIARALKLSPTTVGYYVKASQQSALDWEAISRLNDQDLIHTLEPFCPKLKATSNSHQSIDFNSIHCQLKKKGITRELLHEEYLQRCHEEKPISYSEFCRRYRAFKKCLKPSMRQTHVAGEKAFVDYAGPTIPIHDAQTGEVRQAVIFVGVLGASNFTFAEATHSRSMPDWLGSHARMYAYFGGVPELTIPDNEKSGVNKACQYDPEVNPQYAALAAHYNTVILPTRPYKPQDKAKVEVAVQIVERWILARLRHHKFFSLASLNQEISTLLIDLNNKPFKKLSGTRQQLHEQLDKPALKPLPSIAYEFVDIKKVQVNLDYHIEVNKHYYSVAHQYIGKVVEYQLGENLLSIFYQGQRIACHQRSYQIGKATTVDKHMPHTHLQQKQWTPQRFDDWATSVGHAMQTVASDLIKNKPNPECCRRIHLGFLTLAKRYSKPRLEEAAIYACQHHLQTYSQIKSILQTQCDKAPMAATNEEAYDKTNVVHLNIRGPNYYTT
jgi:transposase